ncbi:MAG: protoporphyrinogen oxidase HemJ [Gammaproteobacteria bacterium]|nr:protoporphyrinogen oxidase HemJ [Gammaproteobacteria bacterium]
MLWVKSFHIIFLVTWFAGLFYLPRLFVYHAMTTDAISNERFKVMERKLYYGIMTPGGILTVVFGFWLIVAGYTWEAYASAGWLNAKLTLVAILVGYHIYCGKLLLDFKRDQNEHGHVFYRWLNEVPTVILIGIIILTVVQPF